jgi:glycerol-3-phosphate dehydrogenase
VAPLVNGELAISHSGILPPPVSQAIVSHFCRVESARHLDDVMIRRTSWRHYYRNHLELAENVARWMAAELAWTDAETESEVHRYRRLTGASELPAPHILNGHTAASGHASSAGHSAQTSSVGGK